MSDGYEWWRDALAGRPAETVESEPHDGFYRMRQHKGGPWLPVAIFVNKGGEQIARVAGDVRKPEDVWTYCAGNPVSQADAKHAFEHGHWPGDIEATEGVVADVTDDDDAKAVLVAIIDQAREWAKNPPKPEDITKEIADRAANFDDRVIKVEKAAKVQRDKEFAPIADEIKRLDGLKAELRQRKADWKDLLDKVPRARDVLKDVYVSWQRVRSLAGEDTKCGGQYASRKGYIIKNDPLHPDTIKAHEAAEAEAQKRAEAEQRVRDELAAKAEEERKAQVLAEAERIKAQQKAAPLPAPTPPQRPIMQSAYTITDMQAVMAWALEQDGILEMIRSEAMSAARRGVTVPGITKEEVERAA